MGVAHRRCLGWLTGEVPIFINLLPPIQQVGESGVFRNILEALARDLEERGATNLPKCFIDGTFVVAKKGA